MSLYSTIPCISPIWTPEFLYIKESKTLSEHKLQLPAIVQEYTVIPQLLWHLET
jgi:hypothetical protein